MEILTIERLIAFLIFVLVLPLIAIILLINLFFTSSVIYKSKRIAGKSKIITLYKFDYPYLLFRVKNKSTLPKKK